jgi:hypothetical protein
MLTNVKFQTYTKKNKRKERKEGRKKERKVGKEISWERK